MRLAGCCAIALVAISASASASGPQDWVLEAGTSRAVEVEPYQRVVVVDQDRIEVERLDDDTLLVTALQRTGLATVHLLGEAAVQTLVFDVRVPSLSGRPAGLEPFHPFGSDEQLSYSSAFAAHSTAAGPRGGLVQQLDYGQQIDDTSIDAAVAFTLQHDLEWRLPVVRLEVHTRPLRFGLGDTVLGDSALPGPLVRGVWADWTPNGPLGPFLGAAGGWQRDPACCAVLSRDLGGAAALRGGYAWRGGDARATVGFVGDPDTGDASPMVGLSTRLRSPLGWGWAAAARAGDGYAASANALIQRPRGGLIATARFLQHGYAVVPGYEQANDQLALRASPHVTVSPVVRLNADLAWVATAVADQAAQHVATGYLAAQLDPAGPHGFSVGVGRWQILGEPGASHDVYLAHRFRRGSSARIDNLAQLDLDGRSGKRTVRASHNAAFRAWDTWWLGIGSDLRLSDRFSRGYVRFGGHLGQQRDALSVFGRVGAMATLGDGGARLLPIASADASVAVGQAHAFAASASMVGALDAVSWDLYLRYTLRWAAVRSGPSPLALRGRVECLVFEDLDNDGVADPDERGVPGISVRLDRDRVAWTDDSGRATFRDVVGGPREVLVDTDGWRATRGNRRIVEVAPLRTATVAVPMAPGGRMVVHVFLDRDGDGVRSSDDLFVPAERVAVTREADGHTLFATHTEGRAALTGLRSGWYRVTLDPRDLAPGLAPVDPGRRVEVTEHEQVIVDLPVDARRAIGGRVVYEDRITSAGDVEVVLSTGDRVRTDAEGRFLFRRVSEGEHAVKAAGGQPYAIALGPMPRDVLDVELVIVAPTDAVDELPPEPTSDAPAPPPWTRLSIVPGAAVMDVGDVLWVRVRGEGDDGSTRQVTGDLTWSSSNPAVVEVQPGGQLVAGAEGSARVVVVVGGVRSEPMSVDVVDTPVVGMTLSHTRLVLHVGDAVSVTAWGIYVDGRVVDVTDRVRWEVEPAGVARVGQDGTVTAEAPGDAKVRAVLGGVEGFAVEVHVEP